MAAVRDNAWVGIDVGKTHHWVCAVDADGKTLLSVKVANDEAGIVSLIAAVTALRQQLTWAVDIIGAPSALLLALLAQAGQPVRYASGRVVAAMSAAYVGEGKTDAKDARVIAETARLRRDLAIIDTDTDLVRNLAVLTGHRADLIADRVRMINRLRDLMTACSPAWSGRSTTHRTRARWCCSPDTPGPIGSVASVKHAWPPGCEPDTCAGSPRLPPARSPRPRPSRSCCPDKT